ncbi:hypothetical protein JL09_g6024, partial [Pichia kudriavzevii]
FTVPENTDFLTALTVYAVLIYRLTGDDDLTIGTNDEFAQNEFVLRLNIDPKKTFSELYQYVKSTYENFYSKLVPIETIVKQLQSSKDLEKPPALFKSSFQFSGSSDSLSTTVPGSIRDMAIYFNKDSVVTIHYNSLLYKEERIHFFSEQFSQVVEIVKKDKNQVISKISLITPEQRAVLPDPTIDLDWSNFRASR